MMPTTITGLFHKIFARRQINKQQKAFRRGDGIASNPITVQALLEQHTKKLRSECGFPGYPKSLRFGDEIFSAFGLWTHWDTKNAS